jgi:hypothetical protein
MLRDEFPQGIDHGDFVPLSVSELKRWYETFNAGLDGQLPHDPDFPTEYQDALSGERMTLTDTPFNRAWFAVNKEIEDIAKRVSFSWRVERVMPLTDQKKYQRYVNDETGSYNIALLAAVATVRGSYRTTPKALRAAFNVEFRRHLAATADTMTEQ